MSTEAMKLALEALERLKRAFFKSAPDGIEEWESEWVVPAMNAITAIREALAEQAEQAQPVAYPEGDVVGPCICGSWPGGKCLKCPRTSPPPRKPLTDEGIQTIAFEAVSDNWNWLRFARAIEAAHGIGKGEA
jgi:hypothetical protein